MNFSPFMDSPDNYPPLDSILSQMNPIHTLTFCFVRSTVTLTSHKHKFSLKCSFLFFSFHVVRVKLCTDLPSKPTRTKWLIHPVLPDFIALLSGADYKLWIPHCALLSRFGVLTCFGTELASEITNPFYTFW